MKLANRCRGVSHTPFTAAKLHVRGRWFVGRYHFIFVHLRAYAIRPYTSSIEIVGLLGEYTTSNQPGLTFALSIEFYKICRGVSHTPSTAAKLHVQRLWFVGCYHFIIVHLRAYAIRPYICSIEILGLMGRTFLAFSLTSGRMRYAPTLVRLKSWGCWVKNKIAYTA